ncbi:MAG: hypothetical protein WD847_20675 [Pirellulales bacterium]
MGKQVNFYMTDSDEKEFIEFVQSDRSVGVFTYAMPTEELRLLSALPERGTPFWYSVYLWDRDNSPKPIVEYVPEQQYYVVEPLASEVIKFSRSYIDEGQLVRGRIWAETVGWHREDPARTFQKSEAFRRWFSRLASWIKRKGIRDHVGDFMLPGAAQYAKDGGRLAQVVFARGDEHIQKR